MILATIEDCTQEYKDIGSWNTDEENKRQSELKVFPYSVIVEGDYSEVEMAQDWCSQNIGEKGKVWSDIWYGKIDYDYGFQEFFFETEENREKFANSVPTFYSESDLAKRPTKGRENYFNADS